MPNNGTKIYTETINDVKYGIDLAADVYKVLGVSPAQTGGAYCDLVCANKHGKINKYAKYKPYRIDTFQDPTEAQRKEINYGLTPKFVVIPNSVTVGGNYSNYSVKPWGQWEPPKPGQDFHRPTDLDGYNKAAVAFVKGFKIYSSAGADKTKPILKSPGYNVDSYLYAEVELEGSPNAEIRFEDITVDGECVGDLFLTMLILSADSGGAYAFAAQSAEPIRNAGPKAYVEMKTSDIDSGIISQSGVPVHMIVVALAAELNIKPGLIVENIGPGDFGVSIDMHGANYQHIIVNDSWAQYGDGIDGGDPIVIYCDITGRLYKPALNNSGITDNDGLCFMLAGNTSQRLITWVSNGDKAPADTKMIVEIVLKKNGVQQWSKELELDFAEGINSYGAYHTVDAYSRLTDLDGLRGTGTYDVTYTFKVGVPRQSGMYTYRFFDADNTALSLQYVKQSTITL